MARLHEESARKLSKRTQNVWAAFFVTIASAMFVLQISSKPNKTGLMAMLVSIEERPTEDPLFSSIGKADGAAGSSIVNHHLGQPTGTVEEIHRNHQNSGLEGLGYHFVIGNGYGIDDGLIHLGYRWLNQTPCARLASADPALWNNGVISICLVGNGNRRPFSEPQLVQLHDLSIDCNSDYQYLSRKYCWQTKSTTVHNPLVDTSQKPNSEANYTIFQFQTSGA